MSDEPTTLVHTKIYWSPLTDADLEKINEHLAGVNNIGVVGVALLQQVQYEVERRRGLASSDGPVMSPMPLLVPMDLTTEDLAEGIRQAVTLTVVGTSDQWRKIFGSTAYLLTGRI